MSDISDARSIFLKAIEAETPAQRNEFINSACGDDAALRGRVNALLGAYDDPDSFFEQPLGADAPRGQAPTIELAAIPERTGSTVGRYKLLQEIGEGGFGVVYMAEQAEPVRRKVALKIIKPGMDSRQVIARFEAERQALALMDHNNIARVLDAGSTNAGLPYFVMELVKGVPITKYCDDAKLSPKERLELFIPVCHAVQHAHQKGVIHRDLKPSNVLVALYDGRPVPKVIDFGVAKATQQSLTQRTMFTELGQIIGTFQYMSPEQAEMNQLDIDTRSDVYSLGVLLYELLTGSTPIAMQQLREAGLVEMLRTIRETEPPKPSTRLSESGGTLTSISDVRKTEPDKLARLMRGDLDWIVMKALEKDRSRRYESANDLASDIERHLHQEPVLAAGPSTAYRIQKFVSRNKSAVGAAAIFALLLLAFGVVSAYQAQVAMRSARRAQSAEAESRLSLKREQQAREAAEQDRQRAKTAADLATTSEEQALDQLARSEYEQARAVRLLDKSGRRFQALKLLERAEELRNRPRIDSTGQNEPPTSPLPAKWELRSEAVAALLTADGQVTQSWKGVAHTVSPDRRFLASVWIDADGMEGGLQVVELDSGRILYNVAGAEAQNVVGTQLSVASDGERLAVVQMDFRSIKLIDLETKQVERTLTFPGGAPMSGANLPRQLQFSPNGRWLVAGSGIVDVEFVLWDLHDTAQSEGRVIANVKQITLAGATFSPADELLAWVSGEQAVTLYDLQENREHSTMELPLKLDSGVAFTADGSTVVVHGIRADDQDRDANVLAEKANANTDDPRQTRRGALLLWDVQQQSEIARYATNLTLLPKMIDVSGEGRRVAIAQMTGTIEVVVLDDGQHIQLDHGAMLQDIAWTSDGQHLVSSGPSVAKLWVLSGQLALRQLALETRPQESTITRFALGPQDELIAAEFAKTRNVGLFDWSSGVRTGEFEIPNAPFPAAWLTFTTPGEQLMRFGKNVAIIWDVEGEQDPIRVEMEESGEVYESVGFPSDGQVLLGGLKKYVPQVRDALTERIVWTRGERMIGAVVRVSHDGQYVVSHDGAFDEHPRSIAVRELPSGELLQQFPSAANAWMINTLLEISSDSRWVLELEMAGPVLPFAAPAGPGATGMTSTLGGDDQPWNSTLWNIQSGELHWRLQGDASVDAAIFSPDGRYLAISQRNGTVLVSDVEQKRKLFIWQAWPQNASLGGLTHQLAFSSDGRNLVVTDSAAPAINLLDLDELQRELEDIGLGWAPEG